MQHFPPAALLYRRASKREAAAAAAGLASAAPTEQSNEKPIAKLRQLGYTKAITLYADRIETPEGTSRLTPDVAATVEAAGSVSHTLSPGKLILGGALLGSGTKKHDSRELWLTIDTPDFQYVTKVAVGLAAKKARKFAAAVNTAARQSAPAEAAGSVATAGDVKVCPDCAEEIKAAANVCRFCGHRFDELT